MKELGHESDRRAGEQGAFDRAKPEERRSAGRTNLGAVGAHRSRFAGTHPASQCPLRRMEAAGNDLTRPRGIESTVVFPALPTPYMLHSLVFLVPLALFVNMYCP